MNAKYPEGAKIVKYVSSAASNMISLLSRVEKGLDHSLLENLFSIPDPNHKPKPSPTKKGRKKDPPPSPNINKKNFYLNCNRIDGGFNVTPHEKATHSVAGFSIRAAYEVAKGNPFKKHHSADFDFLEPDASGIKYAGHGIDEDGLTSEKPNILIVKVSDPDDFSFSVTGFDSHRDLILDVKPIKYSEVESSEITE